MSTWRIGGKVPLNVYENDKPMFQCHAPEDASRIVDALNRTMNPVLHINTEAEQIAQLQRELAEVRKWVNCGGAPSGRLCCFDPLDMHEIYGGGQTLQDGSFICDVHAVQRAYEQLAAERERAEKAEALEACLREEIASTARNYDALERRGYDQCQQIAALTQERDTYQQAYMAAVATSTILRKKRDTHRDYHGKLQEAILAAHVAVLPQNWEYVDPATTIDLMKAEITCIRTERDTQAAEAARLRKALVQIGNWSVDYRGVATFAREALATTTAGSDKSLLREPGPLPEGCYCKPGRCMAPVIMGRQMPCRDPGKAVAPRKPSNLQDANI